MSNHLWSNDSLFMSENRKVGSEEPAQTEDKVSSFCSSFFYEKNQKFSEYTNLKTFFAIMEVSKKVVLSIMMTQNIDKKKEQIQMFLQG